MLGRKEEEVRKENEGREGRERKRKHLRERERERERKRERGRERDRKTHGTYDSTSDTREKCMLNERSPVGLNCGESDRGG